LKRPAPILSILFFALLLSVVIESGRCVEMLFPGKTDFSRRATNTLSLETTEFLESLNDPVMVTFAVTGRDQMPSGYKRLEKKVVALLKSMRSYAPGKFEYEVIDPSLNEDMHAWAAGKKIAPVHIENIFGDRKTSKEIWSALVIQRGTVPDAIIPEITEDHVEYLEQLIIGHIKNMSDPIKPVIGISATDGYTQLESILAQQGTVKRINLDAGDEITDMPDILYWMEPKNVGPSQVATLKRLLDSGRNVIIADSLYRTGLRYIAGEGLKADIMPVQPVANDLLKEFGLEMEPAVVLDEMCESVVGPAGPINIPIAARTVPITHDFRNFAGPSMGALLFMSSSPIGNNPLIFKKAGYEIQNLVTTSEKSWTLPLARMTLSESDLAPTVFKPKQPLAVMLNPSDPFRGRLLVFGSPSLFHNDGLARPGFAHRVFINVLGRTFLSGNELVRIKIEKHLPERLAAASPAAALFWRMSVILLAPFLALLYALVRFGSPRDIATMKPGLRFAAMVAVALIVSLVIIRAAGVAAAVFRADLTSVKSNSLAPVTLKTLGELDREVRIEYYASPKRKMPPAMKQARDRVAELLSDLARESGKIKFEIVNPEELSDSDRAGLIYKNVVPAEMEVTEYDSTVKRNIWSSVSLSGGGAEYSIPLITNENIDQLEFFIIMGLKTMRRGRPYHIAIVSDLPRLSPAEAFEDYYKRQLSAPVGSDVYSEAKRILRNHNFIVSHVSVKEPVIPPDTDVLVWLQPRRPVEAMGVAFGNYLATGGKALLAAQHFNIQQRQYSGGEFNTVYWPQPQYMDLNQYLELFGVSVIREIFMDKVQSRLALEMQINRLAVREYENQAVAMPFLIRAIAPDFSATSPITSWLGDLLFIWGNRISTDKKKLASLGLESEVLITSSADSWDYKWEGGFLGNDVFKKHKFLGRQPLALLLNGSFPSVELYTPPAPKPGPEGSMPQGAVAGAPEIRAIPGAYPAAKGELIIIGCSEMFKNTHINEPEFQHDKLLLNAIVYLALGPDAAALQSKRIVAKGFEQPDDGTIILLRLITIVLPPAVILIFGLAWLVLHPGKKVRRHGKKPI
jgi:ABC-type uncharacterized transport system involved in gliding motility auxiliary subunit